MSSNPIHKIVHEVTQSQLGQVLFFILCIHATEDCNVRLSIFNFVQRNHSCSTIYYTFVIYTYICM